MPSARPPIARDRELSYLGQRLERALQGDKRAVVLLGSAGVGKTSLLRWTHEQAQALGMVTALVRVPSARGLPPRFPVGEILEQLAREHERRGGVVEDRLDAVINALLGLVPMGTEPDLPHVAAAFETLRGRGSLGVFVDDFPWAPGHATNLLMATLRVIELPLFFCGTARLRTHEDPLPSRLPEPTADLWVDYLDVQPIDLDGVRVLAEEILGSPLLPSVTERVFETTGGNPLFVIETLREWQEAGKLRRVGGYCSLSGGEEIDSPRSLQHAVAARVSRLGSTQRSVADVLAIVGREADLGEIASIAGLTQASCASALEALSRQGVVIYEDSSQSRLRLAHPLYRTALLEAMTPYTRRGIHGVACTVMRRRREDARGDISAAELAHHAVESLTPPSDLKELIVAAAAEAATAGSSQDEAAWHARIGALSGDDPVERRLALQAEARATARFDPQKAISLFTSALELADAPATRGWILLHRANTYRIVSQFDHALRDLNTALPLADSEDQFHIRHGIAVLHAIGGDIDSADTIFRQLADESAGTPNHAKALGHLAMVCYGRGQLVQSRLLMAEALEQCQDDDYRGLLSSNLAWMELLLGEWDLVRVELANAIDTQRARGSLADEASMLCTLAKLEAWTGNIPEALDIAQLCMQAAIRVGSSGDRTIALDAIASALIEDGRAEEVPTLFHELEGIEQTDPREVTCTYAAMSEACSDIGEMGLARRAAGLARDFLPQSPVWAVAVDRADARISAMEGDLPGAMEKLQPWLSSPSPILFEQASSLEVLAATLDGLGDRAEAIFHANDALDRYERLGATLRAARVRNWISEREPRRRGRPPSRLPGGLTERELDILRLAAQGKTNKQIAATLTISPSTVKKHVENILAKVGASRRAELSAYLSDVTPSSGTDR